MPTLPPALSAEDISTILGAVAALITAVGAGAWWKARKEVANKEGPSAMMMLLQAIQANTYAVSAHADSSQAVIDEIKELRRIVAEIRLDMRSRR